MNRARLEGMKQAVGRMAIHGKVITANDLLMVLDALLEGAPGVDVGDVNPLDRRLRALETEQDDLARRVTRREKHALAMGARLAGMREREEGAGRRPLVLELLDALLGPAAVGVRQEWITGAEMEAPRAPDIRRGASPCPVCGHFMCLGEKKWCDQRVAERKAGG